MFAAEAAPTGVVSLMRAGARQSYSPYFLMPAGNVIERVVSATLPVHFEPALLAVAGGAFLLLFLAVSLLSFRRLGKIKPHEYLR